jgi:hypothetical protein
MTPSIPNEIFELHRALLSALRVDYFPPGLGDVNMWRDFLFVLEPLKDSVGGPLTAKDISYAVGLMRLENKSRKAGWSLRFARILHEPESFRDLVLQARKAKRDRAPVETASTLQRLNASTTISRLEERDPAAANPPKPLRELLDKMKGPTTHAQNKETDSN